MDFNKNKARKGKVEEACSFYFPFFGVFVLYCRFVYFILVVGFRQLKALGLHLVSLCTLVCALCMTYPKDIYTYIEWKELMIDVLIRVCLLCSM